MSPNITREKKKDFNTFKSREFIKINKDLIKLKVFVEKNFEFVGDKFPRQVRDIYYNNKKNKNIYGTVSSNERKELEEEGIELTSVPWVINKKN